MPILTCKMFIIGCTIYISSYEIEALRDAPKEAYHGNVLVPFSNDGILTLLKRIEEFKRDAVGITDHEVHLRIPDLGKA